MSAAGAPAALGAAARQSAEGLLISYATIVLMLAAGEIYFRYFHVDTEGRLASNNWMARYWHDNSQGFRDREWTPADWAGKTTIAVVGDSFTAGWGIENPADRFSDVLAQHLGSGLRRLQSRRSRRIDAGRTDYSLRALPDPTPECGHPAIFPQRHRLRHAHAWAADCPYRAAACNCRSLVSGELSLFARRTAALGSDYWAAEYANYDNPAIWNVHEQELNDFIDYVESIHARLIVVIFPNLQDPVRSIAYVDRVAQVFEARGSA